MANAELLKHTIIATLAQLDERAASDQSGIDRGHHPRQINALLAIQSATIRYCSASITRGGRAKIVGVLPGPAVPP